MSSQSSFENNADRRDGADIAYEIHKYDSSLGRIYEKRLQLAVRLEENLALHRAISIRQRHLMLAVERIKSVRSMGRIR